MKDEAITREQLISELERMRLRVVELEGSEAERKQAEETLRRYANQQTVLYAVASAVATSLDPDELLGTVLNEVLLALDAHAGWVILPGPTGDEPGQLAVSAGVPESFHAAHRMCRLADCPVCGPLLLDATAPTEPIVVSECPCLPTEVLAGSELRCHVGIPLCAGSELLGILTIGWSAQRPYTESDRALLTAIGRQVGVALYNAQLYQAARQVDRLRVINELQLALGATLELETIAEAALLQVSSALDVPVSVLVYLPSHLIASVGRVYAWDGDWSTAAISEKDLSEMRQLLRRLQGREAVTLPSHDRDAISDRLRDLTGNWTTGLVAPIRDDAGLVALLALGNRSADQPFTEEDRALVEAVAGHVGQALQHAQLYWASQAQSERLSALNLIGAAAVSTLERDTILRRILELACQVLDAMAGSILLSDPDTGQMRFGITLEEGTSSLHGRQLASGQGIAHWVATHLQSVIVDDVSQDLRWSADIDAAIGFETHSLMCAPMTHRGEITGVIEIVNKRTGTFTREDLGLLEAVCASAATALENARLYEATKARAGELASLNEIGLALGSSLDRGQIVEEALASVRRLFQSDGTVLLQPVPQADQILVSRATAGEAFAEFIVQSGPNEGAWDQVFEQGQPVLLGGTENRANLPPPRLESLVGGRPRAMMTVPVLAGKQVMAALGVFSRRVARYSQEDLRLLEAVAVTLAASLENVRLFDELRLSLRERELTQAQLVHSEKMAALGRLTASMAHEINNPLQAVQGCLALVQEDLEDRQPRVAEPTRKNLNVAQSEIDRISDIVQRTRDFYRPARGGKWAIDLEEVLESVLTLTGKQLEQASIAVQRKWAKSLPAIHANADHLEQVFLNLVLNAIDAMPRGGTLSISTSPDQIQVDHEQHPRGAVRVEFSDTGEGMTSKQISRVFEPFFTTKTKGTGLGLSITYGIVHEHQGTISVESQVGKGSSFVILLPVERS